MAQSSAYQYNESSGVTEKSGLISSGRSKKRSSLRLYLVLGVATALVLLIIVAAIAGGVAVANSQSPNSASFSKAAVAADSQACSDVGVEILQKGGSAVDAAIATQLCSGVVNFHSTGIGGGGFMVYHNASSGETVAMDFRAIAPLNASTFMYNGTAADSHIRGGLAIAVPGEILGFDMAWRMYGRLNWSELFEPAIKIAMDGIPISRTVAHAIQSEKEHIQSGKYEGLRELVTGSDGELLKEGDVIKRPRYGETLEMIADNGAEYFYSGEFMETMVQELQEQGSIITPNDFLEYSVKERDVTLAEYNEKDIMGISAPGGGPVLSLIVNILNYYNSSESSLDGLHTHRIIEAMKYTYAQRLKLGDPDFDSSVEAAVQFMLDPATAESMREGIDDTMTFDPQHYIDFGEMLEKAHDHGTSHLSLLAENGDAVAMTNSVNGYMGSLVRSTSNGIIFNNLMADFSIPGRSTNFDVTQVNYIEPSKRPLSSMTPTIVADEEGVKMVVGASGGSRITTAVAQVVLGVLGFSQPLNEAINRRRFHHQLIPNKVSVESDFPGDITADLEERGHVVEESGALSVVQGLFVQDKTIFAVSDPRKGGIPAGY